MMNRRMHMRIRTPSRLHFGLLGWGAQARRQFGGVGLMIDAPGIDLTVEPSSSWFIEGPRAARVEQLVDRLRVAMREAGMMAPPAHIHVDSVPPEHVGLGVGTQLCLAVARAVFLLAGRPDVSVEELARWTGRGRRSGIGLHGFEHGGLIVDGGRPAGTTEDVGRRTDDIPPLLARLPFPEDWLILIVRPPDQSGLHGADENRAFASLPPITQDVTDSLCRLVLLEILPAVLERDLAAFGAALGELQARVGACFAPAQGGIYSTAQASRIIDALRDLGLVGAGQSSWGPTLYAFSCCSEQEIKIMAGQVRRQFGLDETSVFWTRADNQGTRLSVES
jgi:beta-ribofuranosylaminobenzene 5'-phosphate synthase